jgi:hypothetical protein
MIKRSREVVLKIVRSLGVHKARRRLGLYPTVPVLPVGDASPDLATPADNRRFCLIHGQSLSLVRTYLISSCLPVHSADLTAWTEYNEPGELYAEIRMDGVVVHRTKAVKRSDVLFWDETLPMYV